MEEEVEKEVEKSRRGKTERRRRRGRIEGETERRRWRDRQECEIKGNRSPVLSVRALIHTHRENREDSAPCTGGPPAISTYISGSRIR